MQIWGRPIILLAARPDLACRSLSPPPPSPSPPLPSLYASEPDLAHLDYLISKLGLAKGLARPAGQPAHADL